MNTCTINVAGFSIELQSPYRLSPSLYRDFRVDAPGVYSLSITDDDIQFSVDHHKRGIKTECIMQKVSNLLINHGVLLMHGVAIAVDKCAYLFVAPSRTGKTTHARLWLNYLPAAYIVNGDKPFLKFTEDGSVLACGTPWAGKENMYTNTMLPLKSIIMMERAEDNQIEQVSFAEAFPFLLQQTYRPKDKERMCMTLQLLQRLSPTVAFWRFRCNNFKDDCFDVAYNALVRDEP